jgi:hypothetical protein
MKYRDEMQRTISMYGPALAMARYSPSCEKLRELILWLYQSVS